MAEAKETVVRRGWKGEFAENFGLDVVVIRGEHLLIIGGDDGEGRTDPKDRVSIKFIDRMWRLTDDSGER